MKYKLFLLILMTACNETSQSTSYDETATACSGHNSTTPDPETTAIIDSLIGNSEHTIVYDDASRDIVSDAIAQFTYLLHAIDSSLDSESYASFMLGEVQAHGVGDGLVFPILQSIDVALAFGERRAAGAMNGVLRRLNPRYATIIGDRFDITRHIPAGIEFNEYVTGHLDGFAGLSSKLGIGSFQGLSRGPLNPFASGPLSGMSQIEIDDRIRNRFNREHLMATDGGRVIVENGRYDLPSFPWAMTLGAVGMITSIGAGGSAGRMIGKLGGAAANAISRSAPAIGGVAGGAEAADRLQEYNSHEHTRTRDQHLLEAERFNAARDEHDRQTQLRQSQETTAILTNFNNAVAGLAARYQSEMHDAQDPTGTDAAESTGRREFLTLELKHDIENYNQGKEHSKENLALLHQQENQTESIHADADAKKLDATHDSEAKTAAEPNPSDRRKEEIESDLKDTLAKIEAEREVKLQDSKREHERQQAEQLERQAAEQRALEAKHKQEKEEFDRTHQKNFDDYKREQEETRQKDQERYQNPDPHGCQRPDTFMGASSRSIDINTVIAAKIDSIIYPAPDRERAETRISHEEFTSMVNQKIDSLVLRSDTPDRSGTAGSCLNRRAQLYHAMKRTNYIYPRHWDLSSEISPSNGGGRPGFGEGDPPAIPGSRIGR